MEIIAKELHNTLEYLSWSGVAVDIRPNGILIKYRNGKYNVSCAYFIDATDINKFISRIINLYINRMNGRFDRFGIDIAEKQKFAGSVYIELMNHPIYPIFY